MKPIPITGERLLLALDWLTLLTGHYCCPARHRPDEPNPRGFATGPALERFVKERFPKLSVFADGFDGAESVGKTPLRSLRLMLRNNPKLQSHTILFGEELENVTACMFGLFREDMERFLRQIASGEITEADLMDHSC